MKQHLGARVPSTMMVAPFSERFVNAMERFVETEGVERRAEELARGPEPEAAGSESRPRDGRSCTAHA